MISRQRPGARRVRHANGRLEYSDDPAVLECPFLPRWGTRAVISEFTMTDVVTIPATCPSLRCGRI